MNHEPNLDDLTPVIVDLVKNVVQLLQEIQPDWQKAYLRFCYYDFNSIAKGTYVHQGGIDFFSPFQNGEFFNTVMNSGKKLLAAMGKEEGLFLLIIRSSRDFEIKFEFQDMSLWQINKMDGRTGIPEGIE